MSQDTPEMVWVGTEYYIRWDVRTKQRSFTQEGLYTILEIHPDRYVAMAMTPDLPVVYIPRPMIRAMWDAPQQDSK